MEYLIVSFRSRAETMRFVDILRGMGAEVAVVNTPRGGLRGVRAFRAAEFFGVRPRKARGVLARIRVLRGFFQSDRALRQAHGAEHLREKEGV